jgi:hypothetical protein
MAKNLLSSTQTHSTERQIYCIPECRKICTQYVWPWQPAQWLCCCHWKLSGWNGHWLTSYLLLWVDLRRSQGICGMYSAKQREFTWNILHIMHNKRKKTSLKFCKKITHVNRSQDSLVSIVTRLWTSQPGILMLAGAREFSLLRNIWTSFAVHTASYAMGTRVLFLG